MKKVIVSIVIAFVYANALICQCDLRGTFVVDVDYVGCCEEVGKLIRSESDHDTMSFKFLLYDLLCDKNVSYEEYNSKIDSLVNLENLFLYSTQNPEGYSFRIKNPSKIRDTKRRLYKLGYNNSLDREDYLNASIYAKRLKSCYNRFTERHDQKLWQNRELVSYQDYVENNYLALIEFHDNWLFRDTTNSLMSYPPFEGYSHLVDLISERYSKSEFESILEQGINTSRIELSKSARPRFLMKFELEGMEYSYYDHNTSLLYMPDTILVDTVVVYDCYGKDAKGEYVQIQNDTIYNQISDLSDMTKYREKLRKTILFGILRELED